MTAVAAPAAALTDPVLNDPAVAAHPRKIPDTWTVKKIQNHSLNRAPGPSGVAQRIGLWLDEWSMKRLSHDSHHWATKSEVLRGLKNISQQVGR